MAFFEDLGRLVLARSNLRVVDAGASLAVLAGREPEIGDFQVVRVIYKEVLRLQITMHDSRFIVQIVYRTQQLLEVEAGKPLRKPLRLLILILLARCLDQAE